MMANLPVLYNSGKGSRPGRKKRSARGPEATPIEKLRMLRQQLEDLLSQAAIQNNPAQHQKLRKALDAVREALGEEARPRSQEVAETAPPGGDQIHVLGGEISSGSVVGEGVVASGQIAGGDITNNQIEPGGTHIHHVEQLILPNARETPSFRESATQNNLERIYLSRLSITSNRIPLGQLGGRTGGPDEPAHEVRLESIYVPLDIMRTESTKRTARDPRNLAPVPVLSAAIRQKRLMILGDPGSGKTTFLNYLTLILAHARLHPERNILEHLNVPRTEKQRGARWKYGRLLPIRVDLRDFAHDIPKGTRKGSADLLWTHITTQLTKHGLGDFSSKMLKELRNGNCLVMLDGLDEVPDHTQRSRICESITDFADTYTGNRYIATCRVISYTNPKWKLSSFKEVRLAPLSEEAITVFVRRWYSTLLHQGYGDQRWASEQARRLIAAATNELLDLAQNPMLLTVMAVVHTYQGTLPHERARLYDECIDLLLWKWREPRFSSLTGRRISILNELGAREKWLLSGLCEVAFHAHRSQGEWSGTAYISETEVVGILRRYLDNDWEKAQRFCQYVEEEAGLLVGRGEGQNDERMYSFPHRGFQEFLAGQHIVSSRDFARLIAELTAEGDIWHEVLLLAIGHLVFNQGNINRPLEAINTLCKPALPTSDAGWRAVWWAAEMLHIVGRKAAEGDEYLGKDVVPRVIDQLTLLVREGRLTPRERAQAADILGLLGDPRPGVARAPEMVRLEGGTFRMGEGKEAHRVTIRPFYLARYPVTNAQFRLFASDGGYQKRRFWTEAGWEWRTQTRHLRGLIDDPLWGIDNRPVVRITWHEAVAFANWLAARTRKPYRLPTEAEWEFAAAGTEQRRYPFGSQASPGTANARDAGIGQTTAVGIFPQDKTPEGLYDMGGNVWEWCSSLALSYPYRPDDGREDLEAAGARILRGGAYESPRREMHSTYRRTANPQASVPLIGFRLAMDAR